MKNEFYMLVSAETGLPVSNSFLYDEVEAMKKAKNLADSLGERVNMLRCFDGMVEIYLSFVSLKEK